MTSSSIGWTFISRDAVRKSDKALPNQQGTVDELGFLQIQRGYGDLFFPGTSVLHTRLRYAFFVPWSYITLQEKARADQKKGGLNTPAQLAASLREIERQTTGWLNASTPSEAAEQQASYATDDEGTEWGVIGGKVHPREARQPASYAYWSALKAWKILNPNAPSSRNGVLAAICENAQNILSDMADDYPTLGEVRLWNDKLPSQPKTWNSANLSFALTKDEADFICGQWKQLLLPNNTPSLLAHMADKIHTPNITFFVDTHFWQHPALLENNKPALQRAGKMAGIAWLGRAAYAALLQKMCEAEKIKLDDPNRHKQNFHYALKYCRDNDCARLDIDAVYSDIGKIEDTLKTLLNSLISFVENKKGDPSLLNEILTECEKRRKGRRARLPNDPDGKSRRLTWDTEIQRHPKASLLHYRWHIVKNFFHELRSAYGK